MKITGYNSLNYLYAKRIYILPLFEYARYEYPDWVCSTLVIGFLFWYVEIVLHDYKFTAESGWVNRNEQQ